MEVKNAYKIWAEQYDTNTNKTRDLEAIALKEVLATISFSSCLEIGCGTGKNTSWLLTQSKEIFAVDLSDEMLIKARVKINSDKVTFHQADINQYWTFTNKKFDLVSFSLVLEHIENLDHVFQEASKHTNSGSFLYIGELHPFKQYTGSKARFETEEGTNVVICFNHHVSDFTSAAKKHGFEMICLQEYFDKNDHQTIPRILTILLIKK
ncbi:MAG: class I SAM-dependent methyltransferase [Prolixibacteraceae bacterium]